MTPGRLEAFTDGVIAIIITITVLEMRVPEGASLAAIRGVLPVLAAYALAYVNVGIFWNNHHHMLHATEHVDGRVLWANLFMLFWLSLLPWVIRWADQTGFASLPVAAYGAILACSGVGYIWTEREIVRVNGRDSAVGRALGRDRKGLLSLAAFVVGTALAFVAPWVAALLYLAAVGAWLVPDRRIERELSGSAIH